MGNGTRRMHRLPEFASELRKRYDSISKADWADLYADLFRQMFGETEEDEMVMQDAEKRLDILKRYRDASK